jgi:hypothetical protein
MYAVIYKNKVIVGPMGWNSGIFQGSLEKHGVNNTIPRVAPTIMPYVITADAKVMLVEEVRPNINPLVEYHYGPIWEITETNAVANYEVHDTLIEFARNNYKKILAEERWKKETIGTKFTIQNTEITIETDRETRNMFIQKLSIMPDNMLTNWKFPEGWLTISKLELQQIVMAGASYIQGCFDWEKNISDQIDSAVTKEELIEIESIIFPSTE